MKNPVKFITAMRSIAIIALVAVTGLAVTSCGDGSGSTGGGGNSGENGGSQGGIDGIPGSMSVYVSTSLTDEYAYELAFESSSSPARAAVLAPKEEVFTA